jgi:pimeloyl-ACP methyl ester carboxylesterase
MASSGTIDVGGRRLAWTAVGDGPPLLLVNGYAANAADWDPTFLAELGKSFRVICPDNRGVGESEPGDLAELTIDSMAADLEALLDALELERVVVAGWSMGGFVAQLLALRVAERVAALVLLSTDPGGQSTVLADVDVWDRLVDHSGTPREQATRMISLLFPLRLARDIDRQFGDIVADARARLSLQTLDAQEIAMEAWHATELPAPALPPPVLVAHGSEDVVIPPENADRLAACWPGASVERFAGGGHAFMAQEPVRLARLIADFAGG